MAYWQFPKYVTVAERRRKAERKRKQLMKKNPRIKPVMIDGRALATTWWGKSWNQNLERYADFENRIGRGRSYVRHGAVLDLQISAGKVSALVQGSASKPYAVTITIQKITSARWQNIKQICEGQFDSLNALMGGKFPKSLDRLFTEKGTGLFPTPDEIDFSCSCPDWASMCKHVAATLYGIGARLDEDPSLFFKLRKVRIEDLVSQAVAETSQNLLEKAAKKTHRVISDMDLSDVFGIDLDADEGPSVSHPAPEKKTPAKQKKRKPVRAKKTPPRASSPAIAKKAPEKKSGKGRPGADKDIGIDSVAKIITRSRKGITTAGLVKKTALDVARVRYFIARLKSKQTITTLERGLYVGVKPAKKNPYPSDTQWVAAIIRRSRKGVAAADIADKTGFDTAKIRNMISRLKAQGRIKAISRGVYKKA